jgi:hypothetical protein
VWELGKQGTAEGTVSLVNPIVESIEFKVKFHQIQWAQSYASWCNNSPYNVFEEIRQFLDQNMLKVENIDAFNSQISKLKRFNYDISNYPSGCRDSGKIRSPSEYTRFDRRAK